MTEKTGEGNGVRKRAVKNNVEPAKRSIKSTDYQKRLLKRLRNCLDNQTDQIIQKLESEITSLKQGVLYEIENIDEYNEKHVEAFENKPGTDNVRNAKKGTVFKEKNFEVRDSLLTELFRVPHIRTIYHIFIAFLINLVMNTALHDYMKDGKITVGFRVIYWNFKALPIASVVWIGMQTVTYFVYFCFAVWRTTRVKFNSYFLLRVWDWTFFFLVITYGVLMLIVPTIIIIRLNFTVALSFTLLMEQVRFLMKIHSFVRSCAPKVLASKNHVKETSPTLPNLRKFSYFLFAPTLIYKDEYPRTPQIRWRIAIFHFTEIIGVICFLAFLFENYMLPLVQDFGKSPMELEELILVFLGINTPAVLYFLLGFFSLLHSWMNAFAEILRFGDRMFYQDWWNSGSFPEYYKKWNIVVYDWLYTFVYKDATENLTHSKVTSTWLVFIVSAIFHEFILAFTFRFCYPVLFIVFGILSTCLYFIPRKYFVSAGNFLIWLMLIVGVGFCASLYFMEYFARINCPQRVVSFSFMAFSDSRFLHTKIMVLRFISLNTWDVHKKLQQKDICTRNR